MILTGETEALGEKHYTSCVVDECMSTERWWNDTDRGKLKYWWSKLSNSEGATGCVGVPRVPEFCTR